ncbi:MAG: hypothetical protein ACOY5B_14090 [Spirochaetota bacterium]
MFRAVLLSLIAVSWLSACPDAEAAGKKYLVEQAGIEEEHLEQAKPRFKRISAGVVAMEIQRSEPANEGDAQEQPITETVFFTGRESCTVAYQGEGEIVDALKVTGAEYIFLRRSSGNATDTEYEYTVLRITPTGEVSEARDSEGSAITFSASTRTRCRETTGHTVSWSKSERSPLLVVHEREASRDERCRLTEDNNQYRYYRLTADAWHTESAHAD